MLNNVHVLSHLNLISPSEVVVLPHILHRKKWKLKTKCFPQGRLRLKSVGGQAGSGGDGQDLNPNLSDSTVQALCLLPMHWVTPQTQEEA